MIHLLQKAADPYQVRWILRRHIGSLKIHWSGSPRQRGVVVKLGEVTIRAISVSDLYTETLKYLHQKGFLDKVKQHIPLATSKQRYLIAESPVHPNGKEFVVPVEYKGYYMEAHKDYKNGIRHLCKMLDFCGVTLTYLG